jgi:alcohol dehydrogenase class IV
MGTIIAIGGGETLDANKTIHKRIVELSKNN